MTAGGGHEAISGSASSAKEPWKAFQVRHRSIDVKRDAVVATAAQLFLEHGYRKTSLSLLAARLKITKPALYHYFKNKEEIVAECYRAGIAVIESYVDKPTTGAQSQSTPLSGLAQLRMYVQAYAHVLLTHDFGRCVAQIDDRELSADGQRDVRKLKRRIDQSLRRLVEQGVEDGSIAPCQPMLTAFAIAGAINWMGTWYKPDGKLPPEQIAAEFTRILTSGLGSGCVPIQTI
ncbi:MAG TPA: TetR/AcrR family transcriptional regulator [Acidobacteriaceae bacterium]|nr:TetR/AcrR family transcriptional regulator [Acidobacteriaceae bacterium]